jgi:hypothetical protein
LSYDTGWEISNVDFDNTTISNFGVYIDSFDFSNVVNDYELFVYMIFDTTGTDFEDELFFSFDLTAPSSTSTYTPQFSNVEIISENQNETVYLKLLDNNSPSTPNIHNVVFLDGNVSAISSRLNLPIQGYHVYNSLGQLLSQQDFLRPKNQIDVSQMLLSQPSGVYLITLRYLEGFETIKIFNSLD